MQPTEADLVRCTITWTNLQGEAGHNSDLLSLLDFTNSDRLIAAMQATPAPKEWWQFLDTIGEWAASECVGVEGKISAALFHSDC